MFKIGKFVLSRHGVSAKQELTVLCLPLSVQHVVQRDCFIIFIEFLASFCKIKRKALSGILI